MTGHELSMETGHYLNGHAAFRAVCSCGWKGPWKTTNACMGNGRSHVAAMRRRRGPS